MPVPGMIAMSTDAIAIRMLVRKNPPTDLIRLWTGCCEAGSMVPPLVSNPRPTLSPGSDQIKASGQLGAIPG